MMLMSAVGDVVHGLPVVNAIKQRYPKCHVTWILQPGPAMLVRGHPNVDEIILFDRSHGIRGFLETRQALRTRRFDLVVDLQVYFKANIITSFINAPVKLGFDWARARDLNWLFTNRRIASHVIQHAQDQYLEFLDALRIPHDVIEWQLGPWPEERSWQAEWRARFNRPIAAVVVATSKPEKDWVPERWAAVCDALYADYGLQPVLVGGQSPREIEAERIIMARAKHAPVSALGSGLRKLVSILDSAALVLAPDTGPLHMAVALDRPVISLLGYTNPKRTGPYKKFQSLVIDAYADPGEEYGPTMENRPNRMSRITVDDVLQRVERWREIYALG